MITIPDSVGRFFLAMDTSEDQLNKRIDGGVFTNNNIPRHWTGAWCFYYSSGFVGSTPRRQSRCDDNKGQSQVAFPFSLLHSRLLMERWNWCLLLMLRNGGQYSSTVVQSITISADKPFAYKVQSIVVESSCSTFDISITGSSRTDSITIVRIYFFVGSGDRRWIECSA